MAAGLGSSLSLFPGLSVHHTELSPPPTATPRFKMGSLFSKEKHRRRGTHDNYRPFSSGSRAAQYPQQSYPQNQLLRIDPRDQRPTNARTTGKRPAPKPQYALHIYCIDCRNRKIKRPELIIDCTMARDLNVMMPNSTYAFRDPMHNGDVTQWNLGIDLCSPGAVVKRVMDQTAEVVRRFTGDATYGGTRKDLFLVDSLLEELEKKHLVYMSSI